MFRWGLIPTGLLLSTVLLCAPAAEASVIVALPEPQLTYKADVIVFGTIVDTETVVNERSQVVTRAALQVYRAVRGAKPQEILTLQVPGGELPNGLVAYTAGSPMLEPGQRVFGFLERWGDTVRPMGLAYGLLKVRKDADGTYRVTRDVDGLAMLSPKGDRVPPDVYTLDDEPLEGFIERLQGHLAGFGIDPGDVTTPGGPGAPRR